VAIQAVALVAGLALDEHLRGEAPLAAFDHGEMDMRRAARVRHGTNGAESVAALGIGHHGAEALEVGISRPLGLADVVVLALGVALPDFHARARPRGALPIDDATGDMEECSLRGRRATFHPR